MSANNQHEIHPDAEMLSAFAEQALGKHERGEVLAHLAVCGRCRQIVSLASEAASAAAVTPAVARHAEVRPRVWWRSRGLALAPVAALAATAVVAIYVHEQNVKRSAETAKVEHQQTNRNAEPAQPSMQPQAEAVPPAPVAPVITPPKTRETERPRAEKRAPIAGPDENVAALAPGAMNEPDSAHDEPGSPAAELHGSIARVHAPPDTAFAPSRPSASQEAPPEIAMYDEERRLRAEEKATEEHRFAAKAATPAGEFKSGSGTAGSNEQVAVTDQRLETQPAPTASVGSLMRYRAGEFSTARAANRFHLPSGLPAISIAHEGPRMLAIDNAGALFLSEDSGANWEPVTTQWTGRAVMVRKRAEPRSAAAAPSADKSNVPGNTTGREASSESDTVFELLNDQGQLWWSME